MDSVQNEITHKNYYVVEISLENNSCMRFPVVHWDQAILPIEFS